LFDSVSQLKNSISGIERDMEGFRNDASQIQKDSTETLKQVQILAQQCKSAVRERNEHGGKINSLADKLLLSHSRTLRQVTKACRQIKSTVLCIEGPKPSEEISWQPTQQSDIGAY
jgi:chromosome segregation ATPase